MGNKYSNRNTGANSLRAKAVGLQDQVNDLEQIVGQLMVGIEKQSKTTARSLSQLSELIVAISEIVGDEQINALVEEKRNARLQEAADRERQELEESIAEGWITKSDVISEASFLVGKETQPDGKVRGVGRHSIAFESLAETHKAELLGKTVGAVVRTPANNAFEVLEIYTIDKVKAQAAMAARAEKAQKAAEEAASADEKGAE